MDENTKEAWEERAAILEYDAGMTRKEAEKEATRLMEEKIGRKRA